MDEPALVAKSTDATTWQRVNLTLSTGLSDIVRAGIGCVAMSGGGEGLFSKDTKEWKKITVTTTVPFFAQFRLAYGAGVFVAAGHQGLIFTSADGENWEQRESTVAKNLSFVLFGNGVFFAGGPERVMVTSKDGILWTKFTPTGIENNAIISQVIYANDKYLAVGTQITFADTIPGFVATSTNGTNWTRIYTRQNYYLRGIAFGQDTFVAVGDEITADGFGRTRLLLTSTNGATWVKKTSSANDLTFLSAVSFSQGKFLAIGSEPGLFSEDGVTWEPLKTGFNLSAITSFSDTIVAVGGNGVVIQSEDDI